MRKNTTLFILAFMISAMTFSVIPAVQAQTDQVYPFVYACSSSPEGIDPLGVYDTSSGLLIQNCLEQLFMFDYADPAMPTIPLLAVDMGTWNNDKTEWTLDIESDVTWQDGTPFTASDVVWNFDRLNYMTQEGLCDHYSLWFNDEYNWYINSTDYERQLILNNTVAVDDDTIKFTLNKPWLDFEALLPFWGAAMIKPQTAFAEEIIEIDNLEYLIGTGPFSINSIIQAEKSVLVRYDDYWKGKAEFHQIILQVFSSSSAADQALFNQEVHMIRSLTHENLAVADEDPDVNYQNVPSACQYFFHLGVNSIPWAARKALQYCFNYTYLINDVYIGYLETHTPVPDGMFGRNDDIPGLPYYDVEKAREFLLNDIGTESDYGTTLAGLGIDEDSPDSAWTDLAASSEPLDTFNMTRYWGATFLILITDFASYVGFEITDNNVGDWPTFLNYVDQNENLGIVMGGWCPDYFAAVNQIEPMFGIDASSNWNRLHNVSINTKLQQLHTIPQGDELADAIDDVVQDIIVEQAAAMYLMQSAEDVAWSALYLDESSIGTVFNAQLDKYFYPFKWNHDTVPQWAWDDDWTGDTGGADIPGYSVPIMMAVALGAAVVLMLRKRK
jgi:ABC-type transport system substrate-binding protein